MFLNSGITAAYVGSDSASKIYLGSTLIWPAIDYSTQYFTIEATGSGTIVLISSNGNSNVFYRVNNGNWIETPVRTGFDIEVVSGDKVELYGKSNTEIKSGTNHSGPFSGTTAPIIMYGNIGSLKSKNFLTEASFNIGSWGWQRIFGKMTTLTDAYNIYFPENMSIGSYGAEYMFAECTNLTRAPKEMSKNSITLGTRSFDYAFSGCTALTTGPELLKEDVTNNAYQRMFYGCSSLNYVKCLVENPTTGNQSNWLSGVSQTGTFVKKTGVTWPSGVNGIPSGWTVIEED